MNVVRTEAKMTNDGTGYYDLSIAGNGDLTNEDSFDTDIAMSLFTDKRAVESQMLDSSRRRGWFGDTVVSLTGYEIGSYIWLLEQRRLTNDTVNDAVSYAKSALTWIIELEFATNIEVTGERSGTKQIDLTIKIYVDKDLVDTYAVKLWENSRYI